MFLFVIIFSDIEGQKFALFGFIEKNYKSLGITWNSIARALDEIHYKDLSLEIQQKYCKQ